VNVAVLCGCESAEAQEIYCAPCDLEVLDLPAPRKIATKPRLPGNHKIEAEARREDLSAIYGPGGTA